MSLSILVKSASNLPNVERSRKSDPMCVIILQGKKKKTSVANKNLNPEWKETLTWPITAALSGSESLMIEVFDYEKLRSNRLLGTLSLSLHEVVSRGSQNISSALKSKKGEIIEQSNINLELTYKPPDGGDGEGGKGGGGRGVRGRGGSGYDYDEDDVPIGVGGGGGDYGGVGVGGVDGGAGSGVSISGGRDRAHTARWRKMARTKLPNKPLDWQVRVHVLEARKLLGGQLNPIVKVVCGNSIKETSSRKGTNNPLFDEMLYFSFNERPQEMFDRVVVVKVLNANCKKLFFDALIGSFKFDLGMVYDEAEKCFIHKWLLLTDPDDPSSGAKGYLKISINVIGPGDDPKPSPSTLTQETIDIESNLLRPSGVHLQSGTLSIKIYRGEDMPQMDPGYFEGVKKLLHLGTVQKELVDPYCIVSFAGKEGRTPVIWNEQDPEWNHQLNLGIRFPSMCERIRLRMMDKDKVGNDDMIGTTYLNMSQISAGGEDGFLPTFGPCFINVYGSPREFTDLPDKFDYLNEGLIEGVSYRGRVMLELQMSLGGLPTTKQEPIKEADKIAILPYLRRYNYKLYGAFFSATMVHPIDTPIEFEVSIGNYGNKLDGNTLVQSSTTSPSNPLYDGKTYHYLPWFEQKPCVVVDSQWEDCSYRIISMNILLNVADKLEAGVQEVKTEMAMEMCNINTVKNRLGKVLDGFIKDMGQPLPTLPEKEFTKLDRLRRKMRVKEWDQLEHSASHLRNNPHTLEAMVTECEDYINTLRNMAIEPQQCIPDIVVWMLAGRKRVACTRIPAHKLFYTDGKGRGQLCSKVQTFFLLPPAVEEEKELEGLKDRALVRLMLSLEMETENKNSNFAEEVKLFGGELAVYAETYENEASLVGHWGTKALTRPHWSDSRGKINQPQEAFEPPPAGWMWEGDWFLQPELSTMYSLDDNHDEWQEEIYENQARYPLSSWPEGHKSYWTNVTNDPVKEFDGKHEKELTRDEIKCPKGWLWKEDWKPDMARAVDNKGWEYAIVAGMGNWVPYERNGYMFRRRRWVRLRVKDKTLQKKASLPPPLPHSSSPSSSPSLSLPLSLALSLTPFTRRKRQEALEEGWEYARLAHLTYHISEHRLDFARRRRHLRKLVGDPRKPPIFHFKGKNKDDEHNQQVPRVFVTFKDAHTYQLRAYIYQARDMYGSDRSGLSDPYCMLSFHTRSDRTRTVSETVCPTWDQTILIKGIRIYGNASKVQESPPPIVIEFMDKDTVGRDEFIGRTEAKPVVRLSLMDTPRPRLDWFPITRYNKYAGALLAAFELLPGYEMPLTPPHMHYVVPSEVRPILQKTRVEVLCWGVRDMKRFHLLQITSPLVEFECGGISVKSKSIENTKDNPNFPDPVLSFDVLLPTEDIYAPPLNIRVMDKRSFGCSPLVGTHIVKTLKPFYVMPKPSKRHKLAVATRTSSIYMGETAISVEGVNEALDSDPDNQKNAKFDWWSKYYYSIDDKQRTQQEYVDQGYDKLKIYHGDLEDSFNKFEDLAQTFLLYRGKGSRDPDELEGESVGVLKCSLKIYQLPDNMPPPAPVFSKTLLKDVIKPVECIVRVYVIRAENLMAQDPDGKSDPYIKVKVGKGGKGKMISDKDCYIPSNLNPRFGKMFELKANLPIDHTLTVTVMDWDRFSADDLIGETKIDLENRLISQHRAVCGLPDTFCKRGVNKWRDRELPVQILEQWCEVMEYEPPEWSHDKKKVIINGKEEILDKFERERRLPVDDLGDPKQRLALHVVKNKCNFVPEHVEERTLYNPVTPNISMGTLNMWVDIFPKEDGLPPPIDISLRKPDKYVLRVVVYNTKDVLLDISSEDSMSDIYVKGWIRGQDDTQKTDVHYRSMDGEGNFNWRFVFPFEYLPQEQQIVIKKKLHLYSLSKTEVQVPPRLTLQIWDNDYFSRDEFIGTIDFNLSGIPKPAKVASDCSLDQLPPEEDPDQEKGAKRTKTSDVRLVDLFHKKRLKGWWPVFSSEEGERDFMGKLELDIEVLSEEEALLKPAARSRDEPNQNPHLEEPHRPATSFLWFTSPQKTFKHIIWKHYKWHIIGGIVIVLLVILLVIFIYTAPSMIMDWATKRLLPV